MKKPKAYNVNGRVLYCWALFLLKRKGKEREVEDERLTWMWGQYPEADGQAFSKPWEYASSNAHRPAKNGEPSWWDSSTSAPRKVCGGVLSWSISFYLISHYLKLSGLSSGHFSLTMWTWVNFSESYSELHITRVVSSVRMGTRYTSATSCSSCLGLYVLSEDLKHCPSSHIPIHICSCTLPASGWKYCLLRAHLGNFHPLAICAVTLLYNIKKELTDF